MGPLLVVIPVACLVAAAALAAGRKERIDPKLRSAQRRVLLSAVLNLLPGLGLWLAVKRPKAAFANLALAIAVVWFVIWSGPRHFSYLPKDNFAWFFWLETCSVVWGYYAAMNEAGITEQQVLDSGHAE